MTQDFNAAFDSLSPLIQKLSQLQRQAAQQYAPVVDEIVRTHSRDVQRIEQTLDGLLDFCGDATVLELFQRLCRHYWAIDREATAFYIDAYRKQWDSDDHVELL